MNLKEHIVNIFWLKLPEVNNMEEYEKLVWVLDEDEKNRYYSYLVNFKKIEFLFGRLLLKTILAEYLNIPLNQIIFKKNKYGKLFLEKIIDNNTINFNISHTEGLLACVFSLDYKIGIDVEKIRQHNLEIMKLVFSENEIEDILVFGSLKTVFESFSLIWTRKEAIMKAIGQGFAINPKNIQVPYAYGVTKDKNCQFYSFKISNNFLCSVALIMDNYTKDIKYNKQEIDFKSLRDKFSLT
ncbi:4'-phosphopantetheinyl transferase family protein [Bacillus cereus]|uniref:4'-phosphopantetheinyl transferase family protein n=1 Tax=Bacillus cereus TaxID=1396 RepID=UPI00065BBF1B|nr:4'-phosphopantetheinyl transferase superfamily protein [Bacillus cereus]KMQ32159.1 hypothetical protein TU58_01345 [Bacillus cereus]